MGWRIRSVPWKMTLPFTISPMMQPTDQISTEESERHRNINRQNDFISEPELVRSQHSARGFSEAAETDGRRFHHARVQTAFQTPPHTSHSLPPGLSVRASSMQRCLSVYTAVAFFVTFPPCAQRAAGSRITFSGLNLFA